MTVKAKRGEDRIGLRMPIYFGFDRTDQVGHIKNISRQGVAISSRVLIEPLALLQIRFEAEKGPMTVPGQVRWSRRFEIGVSVVDNCDMGIQFLETNEVLMRFVDKLFVHFVENRTEPRFEKVFTVKVADAEKAQAYNINRHGMYVITANPPVINSIVEVMIVLPDIDMTVHVEGQVVHLVDEKLAFERSFEPGFGLRFIKFLNNKQEAFFKYIDALTNAFYGR
jgi:hypothetical protein